MHTHTKLQFKTKFMLPTILDENVDKLQIFFNNALKS